MSGLRDGCRGKLIRSSRLRNSAVLPVLMQVTLTTLQRCAQGCSRLHEFVLVVLGRLRCCLTRRLTHVRLQELVAAFDTRPIPLVIHFELAQFCARVHSWLLQVLLRNGLKLFLRDQRARQERIGHLLLFHRRLLLRFKVLGLATKLFGHSFSEGDLCATESQVALVKLVVAASVAPTLRL